MQKLTRILCASLVISALAAGVASARNKAETFNLTPFVGGYAFDGRQHLEMRPIYGLRGGYNFTERVGVEGVFGYVATEATRGGADASVYNYRLEALYHFFPESRLVPYLAAGYGLITVDQDKQTKTTHGAFNYGPGVKYFLTDAWALRGDVRHLISNQDRTLNNLEYTVGLGYFFGGAKPAPAPVVAPPPVPAAPTSNLTVTPGKIYAGESATLNWNSLNATDCDIQPAVGKVPPQGSRTVSPSTTTAYALSCTGPGGSTSSSASLDVSPKPAPTVAPVVADADGDGVPDSLDKCPNTPRGVTVDQDGCPIDSDKDGVYDYLDKCPDTPLGVKVDGNGCPLDTDGDGVLDYLDKCPDTPKGVKVDKNGCPFPVDKPCETITLNILFDTNKTDIKSQYHDELKKVGDFLNKYSAGTAVIEGHTDSVGSADMNMKLSKRRADSVRAYIIEKFGVKSERVIAKGYGETKPVASNKVAEGRQKNRRIDALFYCGGN
jgi:OOP family OmpA-OmpF porin